MGDFGNTSLISASAVRPADTMGVGTNERHKLARKVKFTNMIDGGEDINESDIDTLKLTDKMNGDVFCLHDSFSDLHNVLVLPVAPDSFGNSYTRRIWNIEKILAGDSDDLIDLTSFDIHFSDDVIIEGGSGNDVIWSSAGSDF